MTAVIGSDPTVNIFVLFLWHSKYNGVGAITASTLGQTFLQVLALRLWAFTAHSSRRAVVKSDTDVTMTFSPPPPVSIPQVSEESDGRALRRPLRFLHTKVIHPCSAVRALCTGARPRRNREKLSLKRSNKVGSWEMSGWAKALRFLFPGTQAPESLPQLHF